LSLKNLSPVAGEKLDRENSSLFVGVVVLGWRPMRSLQFSFVPSKIGQTLVEHLLIRVVNAVKPPVIVDLSIS
jgi:hypothetical protein